MSHASNAVTEQLTRAGQAIEHDSFAIVDREAGPHGYRADEWPLVRRMIHASADFDFNGLTRFHPQVDAIHRREIAKALRQAFGFDGIHTAVADARRDDQFLMRPLLVFRQQLDEGTIERCLPGLRP